MYSDDIDPHHLMIHLSMGSKAPDDLVIPLCRAHHDRLHDAGTKNHTSLLKQWGIDDFALAHAIRNAYMRSKSEIEKLNGMRREVMLHVYGE
jgi:hypothetical protein